MSLCAKLIEVERTKFTNSGTVFQLEFDQDRYLLVNNYSVLFENMISNLGSRIIYPQEAQIHLNLLKKIGEERFDYLLDKVGRKMDEETFGLPKDESSPDFVVSDKLYDEIRTTFPLIETNDLKTIYQIIGLELKNFEKIEESFLDRLQPKKGNGRYSIKLSDDILMPTDKPSCLIGVGTFSFKDNTFRIHTTQPKRYDKAQYDLPQVDPNFAQRLPGTKVTYID